jgi:ubiquinone/menaquinone biosynthesis C-methylase UbiE
MGSYQNQIVPLLINLAMRRQDLAAYRSRIVPAAEGRVLEIGIGSGLNLPFYSRRIEQVLGLDPSPKLLAMARQANRPKSRTVEFIEGSAEQIPLEKGTIDTIVMTWALCSIPDPALALSRNPPCTQANRTSPVRRARSGARSECRAMAGSADADLEAC